MDFSAPGIKAVKDVEFAPTRNVPLRPESCTESTSIRTSCNRRLTFGNSAKQASVGWTVLPARLNNLHLNSASSAWILWLTAAGVII